MVMFKNGELEVERKFQQVYITHRPPHVISKMLENCSIK